MVSTSRTPSCRSLADPPSLNHRLLEFAADYYDVKTFPQGETRRALERVMQGGKKSSGSKSGGDEGRERKKRKKDKSSK